jgi:hypothetical protein
MKSCQTHAERANNRLRAIHFRGISRAAMMVEELPAVEGVIPMRTYDVYRGQEHHARVCVHDDGRKTWEYFSEWRDFYLKARQL